MQDSDQVQPLRILIVDDSPDHANSLASLLIHRGHVVRVAYSSDAALEQAAADKADVVLLDIALPDMDGFELATRLRDLLPSAVFLAVSGHAGEAFQAKARAVGIEQYFVKPVAVAELREVLDSVAKRS